MHNPSFLEQQQMESLQNDMRLMRASMQQIAEAVTQLAVLEEKHNTTALKCQRLEEKIDVLEKEFRTTELDRTKFTAKIDGIKSTISLMWVVAGSGVLYVCGQLFFKLFSKT